MSDTSDKQLTQIPLARCYRSERQDWRMLANIARQDPTVPGARLYLIAHPEREIAAATDRIGVAYCPACDITYKAPWADVDGVGRRMAAVLRFVERHNALIHPRRAARLTK